MVRNELYTLIKAVKSNQIQSSLLSKLSFTIDFYDLERDFPQYMHAHSLVSTMIDLIG